MKKEERQQEKMIRLRLYLLKKIKGKHLPQSSIKRLILKKFRTDYEIQRIFLNRPDLKKSIAISLCLGIEENPNNWLIVLDNENLGFSVPEILFWAIKADKYRNRFQGNSNKGEGKVLELSILKSMLKRKKVQDYFDSSSLFTLLLVSVRLDNHEEIVSIINQKRNYTLYKIFLDENIIFPRNLISFLLRIAMAIPISLFNHILSAGVDIYLENKYKRIKN